MRQLPVNHGKEGLRGNPSRDGLCLKSQLQRLLGKKAQSTLILLLSLAQTPPLKAGELHENFIMVRSLGMGGAFTAIANDASAVWGNPAGIGRIRKARSQQKIHHVTFPNVIGGGNKSGSKFYTTLQKSQTDAQENIADTLQTGSSDLSETPLYVTAATSPLVYFSPSKYSPPTVVGIFGTTCMNVMIDDSDDTDSSNDTAQVESVSDTGLIMGLSWDNFANRLNFGLALRPMIRYSYNDKVDLTTLTDRSALQKAITTQGNSWNGVGIDAGFLFTVADFWFPTVGVAILNLPTGCQDDYLNPFEERRMAVCGTKFSGTTRNSEDTNIIAPTDTRIGLSITPRLSHDIGLRFAVDIHHIYYTSGDQTYGLSGIEPLRQSHAGIELFTGNPLLLSPFSLRAGVGEGFASLGATVRFSFITMEVASYGKDISTSTSPKEDRRIVGSLTGEF